MTPDDVIRMAREASLIIRAAPPTKTTVECLERFAELVAAAERKACAKLADDVAGRCLHPDEIAEHIRARGQPQSDLGAAAVAKIDPTDPRTRAGLIELGWTPPNPHTTEYIPVVAWQHPTAPGCVSTDPTAYTGLSAGAPHELVRKDAVYDRIDWLEHGVSEWRAVATLRQASLNASRADILLLNWLEARGVEGMPWVARASTTGRGYRLHQDKDGTAMTAREAIMQAMAS